MRQIGCSRRSELGSRTSRLSFSLIPERRIALCHASFIGGDFGEHVLVEVALGVAIVHGEFGYEVGDFGEEAWGGDGGAGVAHEAGVGEPSPIMPEAG